MMASLSDEALKARCDAFDENYKEITERVCAAAMRSGRSADAINLLAATR